MLFKSDYSLLLKRAFSLFRQGFLLLTWAINLFGTWHMCGYEIKLVANHLNYFVLICAFIMFVVRYVFIFVNPPLIVESFLFLVHMKFSLLKDTLVLFVFCIMFGVGNYSVLVKWGFLLFRWDFYCWLGQLTCSGSDTCVDMKLNL